MVSWTGVLVFIATPVVPASQLGQGAGVGVVVLRPLPSILPPGSTTLHIY